MSATRNKIPSQRIRPWAKRLENGGEEEAARFDLVGLVQREALPTRPVEAIEIPLGEACTVSVPPGFAPEDLERVLGCWRGSPKYLRTLPVVGPDLHGVPGRGSQAWVRRAGSGNAEPLGQKPLNGHVFVCINPSKNRMKLLVWNRTG